MTDNYIRKGAPKTSVVLEDDASPGGAVEIDGVTVGVALKGGSAGDIIPISAVDGVDMENIRKVGSQEPAETMVKWVDDSAGDDDQEGINQWAEELDKFREESPIDDIPPSIRRELKIAVEEISPDTLIYDGVVYDFVGAHIVADGEEIRGIISMDKLVKFVDSRGSFNRIPPEGHPAHPDEDDYFGDLGDGLGTPTPTITDPPAPNRYRWVDGGTKAPRWNYSTSTSDYEISDSKLEKLKKKFFQTDE